MDRRSLLRFLLSSPLLVPFQVGILERMLAGDAQALTSQGDLDELIADAADAINVFDFRPVAERNLSPAHYTYLSMGVEDEVTPEANREAFATFQLRPRRLVDVRDLDTRTELLGPRCPAPFSRLR